MDFLLEAPWNCLSPPGWLLGHVCQAPHHSATVKPFVDFHLCNIRFLATLFAFSKNKMSLPVACYFGQKWCCFRSMPVRRALVKMVLPAHSLLGALSEILICFLHSTCRRESTAMLGTGCGKQLPLLHCCSTAIPASWSRLCNPGNEGTSQQQILQQNEVPVRKRSYVIPVYFIGNVLGLANFDWIQIYQKIHQHIVLERKPMNLEG